MKVLTCASTAQPISLVQQIASSGEGEIWQTNLERHLAKVYFVPTTERIEKLEVMIAHPPHDPNAHISHISFAWPKSLLKDATGRAVGFLMPQVTDSVDLLNVYNPQRRQKVLPGFDWRYLHVTALNIASIVWAIHVAGYVIGDIKSQNILVNNRALPAIIDTDSFQVRHPETGQLYRCLVGSEGFTPVELLEKDLGTVEQTEIHDRFRLGVIIYLLLFGEHPFKGKWIGTGESPPPVELLRRGWWPYAPNSLIQPSSLTIPLATVHPDLRRCFLRCFNQGHINPAARPTPQEWVRTLKAAVAELNACKKVRLHYYSQSYGKCYWCDRKAQLGVDIFPAPPGLIAELHRKHVQPMVKSVATHRQQLAQKLPVLQLSAVRSGRSQPQRSGRSHPSRVTQPLPVVPPQPQAPPIPLHQRNWIRISLAILASASVLATLSFLSRSKMEHDETGLTLIGILLCSGLVGISLLWTRVLKQPSS